MNKALRPAPTDWLPVSALNQIDENISAYGYSEEYIKAHRLGDYKQFHAENGITGRVDFFEPLEVKEQDGVIYYRENDSQTQMVEPDSFETQFGKFVNHNYGEFASWLGIDDYDGLPEEERENNRLFGEDYLIGGNYCDMFDCGDYSYAVSNLMHMALGFFKVVRIDRFLHATEVFSNFPSARWDCLEYAGRITNANGFLLIASGSIENDQEEGENREFRDRTLLLQIDDQGNCDVRKEWNLKISSSNSLASTGNLVYFGQNKMVTRLNLATGELAFFTNKNEEELAALKKMW